MGEWALVFWILIGVSTLASALVVWRLLSLVSDQVKFDIEGTNDPDGRRRELHLDCREVQ